MKLISRLLLALALSILGLTASAQTETPIVTTPVFGDDSYVHVPLQFGFPFYGRVFTHSWMHSNGVISFLDPAVPVPAAGFNPGQWAYCCQGEQPSVTRPEFSYMIAPLWTDLYPVAASTFRTEGTSQYQRYFWNSIAEISNSNNLNSFSVEIRPSGFIGVDYTSFRIQNQATWVGAIGDATQGQWNEIYYGVGIPGASLKNWSIEDTGVIDQCITNPLSSPTCSGYTAAMCSSNPLYSTECAGYDQAYFDQQCSINTLYNTQCPGYAAAYYTYQCSVSALYHTGCVGYAQAYFDQQCGLDPLYNKSCPGYREAYAKKYILAAPVVTEPEPPVEEIVVLVASAETTTSEAAEAPAASAGPADKTSPVQLTAAPAAAPAAARLDPAPASAEAQPAASGTRQALAERRLQAARAAATAAAAAKANSGEMSSEMDSADSMEQQVELQNVVLGAMGFVAGFDAYGRATIPDAAGYQPFEIYRGQRNIDSPAGRRLLTGSDRLHQDMVDSQYNK